MTIVRHETRGCAQSRMRILWRLDALVSLRRVTQADTQNAMPCRPRQLKEDRHTIRFVEREYEKALDFPTYRQKRAITQVNVHCSVWPSSQTGQLFQCLIGTAPLESHTYLLPNHSTQNEHNDQDNRTDTTREHGQDSGQTGQDCGQTKQDQHNSAHDKPWPGISPKSLHRLRQPCRDSVARLI